MQRPLALLLALAGAAVLVVLFLVLRPGGGDESQPSGTTATRQPPPVETAPPPPAPPVETVRLVVQGGSVRGGLRHVTVDKGARVRLVVTADVSDEVHLHGYDVSRDVAPGRPATIAFRATIAGRFEVELEDRKFQIAELEVKP